MAGAPLTPHVRPVAKTPMPQWPKMSAAKNAAAKRPMKKASLAAINAAVATASEDGGGHAHKVFVDCPIGCYASRGCEVCSAPRVFNP
jgi:hypothetical protein